MIYCWFQLHDILGKVKLETVKRSVATRCHREAGMKGLSPGDFCDNDTAAAAKSLSRVQLCAAPWSAAHQAPPSMGFSRQEYWSGVPLPSLIITLLYMIQQ